jgi:hypothetical protein
VNKFFRGSNVQLDVTFTDSSMPTPQLVDPTQVFGEFFGDDGTVHLPVVTRQSLGKFRCFADTYLLPIVTGQVCKWRVYAPDGDPAQAVFEGAFQVVTAGFSP